MQRIRLLKIINETRLREVARTWKGTPYRIRHSTREAGVDCVHLILAIYKELGFVREGFRTVGYHPSRERRREESLLIRELEKYCDRISRDPEIRPGDLVAIWIGKCPSHLALYLGDGEIIHAPGKEGVNVEPLERYAPRLHSFWRLKYDTT